MINLCNATNGKELYLRAKYIIAVYPGTTGSEILTITGVVYHVKESVKDVLSAVEVAELNDASN